jgi:competence ComEA-like helix-hairpin-helix protein
MFLRRIPIRSLLFFLLPGLIFTVLVAAAGKKKPPAQPVNINTANSEQLQQVPGIGPATADKILQMRKSYGPFKSVDDLLAIRGLGAKRLEKMRKYLTVGRPTESKKPSSPAQNPSSQSRSPVPSSFR